LYQQKSSSIYKTPSHVIDWIYFNSLAGFPLNAGSFNTNTPLADVLALAQPLPPLSISFNFSSKSNTSSAGYLEKSKSDPSIILKTFLAVA